MKAKTKKGAKRAPAQPLPATTTALARIERSANKVLRAFQKTIDATPAIVHAPAEAVSMLGDDAEIGALGMVEVKLTKEEEVILSRPVDVKDVMIKPTGQAYLSHPAYTRWFNEAFGRLGWAIVPRSKPIRQVSGEKVQVVVPHMLYIHGQPAAFAMGEQEYSERNREQTYGDAVEATVASALRRCAKRLGVGLELWDKRFLHAFIKDHCVKVWRGTDTKPSFRRIDDPPFYDERGMQAGDETRGTQENRKMEHTSGQRQAPAAGHDGTGDIVISRPQGGRLWGILKSSGRDEETFKKWLKARYGYTSTKEITRRTYDAICTAIAAPGELPAREPGED